MMIKINFCLLQILAMDLLNVKHQGNSSNQLAFHLSAYRYLWKLSRAIFQKHAKYKLTVWKIQSRILMIEMIWKRKWMTWLGCIRQCNKNLKQHHIQSKSKFLPWYLNILFKIFHCLWIPCLNFTWNQKSSRNISKTCS